MLKLMHQREVREQQESLKKRELEAKNKTEASMALRLQMKEKEAKKTIIKQNDLSYAN